MSEIEFAPDLPIVGASWRPSSLITLAAKPPEPPEIGRLLYVGKRALLSGETESLKTWLALILAKAEMEIGLPVAWADLDAMGAGEILSRLRALGVADAVIDKLFLYYEPTERLAGTILDEVRGEIAERGVRLFVIDAFNSMLLLHGLDPTSTPDVETFWREVATPITAAGATTALLDHVVKNPDARSKYALGAERKASGATVHIGFRAHEPFSRGTTGSTLLATHKDRPGFLPRPTVGKLVLSSDGSAVTYHLEADRSRTGDTFRPTVLMERVSMRLEAEDEAQSQTWIEKNVTGKVPGIRQAVNVLVDEGFVSKNETSRGHFFAAVRPYRQADYEGDDESEETASPPRPHRVPDLLSTPPSDRVPASPL
jgi:AAA domain-containing protein